MFFKTTHYALKNKKDQLHSLAKCIDSFLNDRRDVLERAPILAFSFPDIAEYDRAEPFQVISQRAFHERRHETQREQQPHGSRHVERDGQLDVRRRSVRLIVLLGGPLFKRHAAAVGQTSLALPRY